MILLPIHLAAAIEWVLRPTSDPPPDLKRLTSEQMQLLPLPIAHAFMDLALAAFQEPSARRRSEKQRKEGQPSASLPGQPPPRELWVDARSKQRARRTRQHADALNAAHQRLFAWYADTGNSVAHARSPERR